MNLFNIISVIILCAGEGIRMGKSSQEVPKPLIKIPSLNNIPILQHTIKNLEDLGINKIFIVKGHLGKQIDAFIASLNKNIKIIDSKDEYKKGPLYSLLSVLNYEKKYKSNNFLSEKTIHVVIPGDSIFDFSLLNSIFKQIKSRLEEIIKYPIIFYRNITVDFLKNKHKRVLSEHQKYISIANIKKNRLDSLLKEIIQSNLQDLDNEEGII